MFGQDDTNQNQTNDVSGGGAPPLDSTTPPPPPAGPTDFTIPDSLTAPSTTSPGGTSDDLVNIKQQALQQLSPLVSHLEQTPEEKFRTTMMMIQASDDQSLIKAAYESAKQITDDKARAQALLDVVNEINYFTQQNNN
jgi:hypothetical protein